MVTLSVAFEQQLRLALFTRPEIWIIGIQLFIEFNVMLCSYGETQIIPVPI